MTLLNPTDIAYAPSVERILLDLGVSFYRTEVSTSDDKTNVLMSFPTRISKGKVVATPFNESVVEHFVF